MQTKQKKEPAAPLARMRSRNSWLSPAMLPNAHTHCSWTAELPERSSWMRQGAVTSAAAVCAELLAAMLVMHQAASS